MRLLLLALLAGLATGCGTTHSSLHIAPGERFVLGGESRFAFWVELRNEGDVPVGVSRRTTEGSLVSLGDLGPSEALSARFGPGTAAVLTNGSDAEARIRATIRSVAELGMRYEGAPDPER